MSLFQQSILSKHLNALDKTLVAQKWETFKAHFQNPVIQENIRQSKEEQYQEGFLRDLFVSVFDYTLNPSPGYNLTTEYKNVKDSKKADGAILSSTRGHAPLSILPMPHWLLSRMPPCYRQIPPILPRCVPSSS